MRIKKAIIPAAGLGTRFLPATKSQPKEMLPIVDKPCIHYLVEEAVKSGIEEIIIVTGRGKRSIEDYFDHSFELHAHLQKNGKKALLKEIERIENMAKFVYVRQPFPHGDGHAILCAKELVKDEPVAILFGDDIWDSKIPPLAQMLKEYEKFKTPIIAVTKIPLTETEKYGIVETEKNSGKVKSLTEKPSPKKAKSNLAITGKYIITPELLETLASKKVKDRELRLIDGMSEFIKISDINTCLIEGKRFDTGDKLGYLQAVVHFGLKHSELKTPFAKYLKGLDMK
ncbi:UTP--glucose-1-phosphate uridylyltransferase [Candidatus Peregrinibacteria bacterium]|nr:UTP--glucose-1-phosphate uridylyltransferase [Candidatus Peregrinibacteria bacterium]